MSFKTWTVPSCSPLGSVKRGIGGQENIRVATDRARRLPPPTPLAVRAALVGSVLHREEFHDAFGPARALPSRPQELAEPLIAAQNASGAIVDQDRVANGIEGVFPLTLHGSDLFKEANVLKRQAQQVRDVDEVGKARPGENRPWRVEPTAMTPNGPCLPGRGRVTSVFNPASSTRLRATGIPFLVGLQELRLFP